MISSTVLRLNDQIAVCAPSGTVNNEQLEKNLSLLESQGLKPYLLYNNSQQTSLYLAGLDCQRADAVAKSLVDPKCQALWTARGGYGAARLFKEYDLPAFIKIVQEAQKPLLGYSDATVLHAVWQMAGVPSMHVPNLVELHKLLPPHTPNARPFEILFDAVIHDKWPTLTGETFRFNETHFIEASLCGGNLAVLASICGTPLMPSWRGKIVVLEDVWEQPYRLDRTLTQLLLARAFDGCKAVVIGQLHKCKPAAPTELANPAAVQADAHAAVFSALDTLSVPVVHGFKIGHDLTTTLPVHFGKTYRLSASANRLATLQPMN